MFSRRSARRWLCPLPKGCASSPFACFSLAFREGQHAFGGTGSDTVVVGCSVVVPDTTSTWYTVLLSVRRTCTMYLFTVEVALSLLPALSRHFRALSSLPRTDPALGTGPNVSGVIDLGRDSRSSESRAAMSRSEKSRKRSSSFVRTRQSQHQPRR